MQGMDSSSSQGANGEVDDQSQSQELPGTSGTYWGPEEQGKLEDLLRQYPPFGLSATERYVLVASGLPTKTVRDVALRVKWMSAQEGPRKRKTGEDARRPPTKGASQNRLPLSKAHSLPLAASSRPSSSGNLVSMASLGTVHTTALLNGAGATPVSGAFPKGATIGSNSSGNATGTAGTDSGQGSDGAAANGMGNSTSQGTGVLPPLPAPIPIPAPGSVPGQEATVLIATLMEHNCAILAHFKANMKQCKVVENTSLLAQYRDNIVASMQHMSAMQGIMQQMPPLPVQPNLELAARVLPTQSPLSSLPLPMSLPPGGAMMLGPSMNMMPPPGFNMTTQPPPGFTPPAAYSFPFPTMPFPPPTMPLPTPTQPDGITPTDQPAGVQGLPGGVQGGHGMTAGVRPPTQPPTMPPAFPFTTPGLGQPFAPPGGMGMGGLMYPPMMMPPMPGMMMPVNLQPPS